MQTINIHAAKTQLSRLVEQAAAGEEIIIAKAGKPVCRLVPLRPEHKGPRKLGLAAGEWQVPDDFDAALQDTGADITSIFPNTVPAAVLPAQTMIAGFAGCWNELSDDDFAAIEAERTTRRHNAFAGRRSDDAVVD